MDPVCQKLTLHLRFYILFSTDIFKFIIVFGLNNAQACLNADSEWVLFGTTILQ